MAGAGLGARSSLQGSHPKGPALWGGRSQAGPVLTAELSLRL